VSRRGRGQMQFQWPSTRTKSEHNLELKLYFAVCVRCGQGQQMPGRRQHAVSVQRHGESDAASPVTYSLSRPMYAPKSDCWGQKTAETFLPLIVYDAEVHWCRGYGVEGFVRVYRKAYALQACKAAGDAVYIPHPTARQTRKKRAMPMNEGAPSALSQRTLVG